MTFCCPLVSSRDTDTSDVYKRQDFNSRLFLGTGKFNNNALMAEAIKVSETAMVTVAMKRIELEDKQDDLLSHIVQNPNIQLLPNTSGVRCV